MTSSLKPTLKALRVPQATFASAIGTRPETVCRWINHGQRPRADYIARILSFLNRPVHLEQLGRTEPFRFEELFFEEAA